MRPLKPWQRDLAWFGTGCWFVHFWAWVWR